MTEPPVDRLSDLLARLEAANARLEALEDPEDAVDLLQELGELAREVQVEIDRARRQGDDAVA